MKQALFCCTLALKHGGIDMFVLIIVNVLHVCVLIRYVRVCLVFWFDYVMYRECLCCRVTVKDVWFIVMYNEKYVQ